MIRPLIGTTSQVGGWLTPPKLERIVRDILGPLAITGDGVDIVHDQPGSVIIDARPTDDLANMPFRVRPVAGGVLVNPGIVRAGVDGEQWFLPTIAGSNILGYPILPVTADTGYVVLRYSKVTSDGAPTNVPWPILFVTEAELADDLGNFENPALFDVILATIYPGIVPVQQLEGFIEIY